MKLNNQYINHHKLNRRNDFIYGGKSRIDPIIKILNQFIDSRHTYNILDIGCRDCAFSSHILKLFEKYKFIGIDVDKNAVDRAKEKGLNAVCVDIESYIDTNNELYDLIILSEVLEHLSNPDNVIDYISKHLSTNGILLCTVPNAFRLKNRLKFMLGINFEDDPTHLKWYNSKMLKHLFSKYNLSIFHLEYINSNYLWLSPSLFSNTIFVLAKNGR